jgi:small subunit ribosomal protein S8
MNTDVIADMLTRMRNALKVGHFDVKCPYSKFKENILVVLKEKKFIKEFSIIKE